jgi:hypothetical protein
MYRSIIIDIGLEKALAVLHQFELNKILTEKIVAGDTFTNRIVVGTYHSSTEHGLIFTDYRFSTPTERKTYYVTCDPHSNKIMVRIGDYYMEGISFNALSNFKLFDTPRQAARFIMRELLTDNP